LKIIKELSKIPRAMGSPGPQDAFLMASGSGVASGLVDGRLNPLAYHNLSDEQYAAIVQGVFAPGDDTGPGGAYAQGTITEVEESEYASAADAGPSGASTPMIISASGGTKRPLEIEDGSVDGVGGKRGRFENVE
jgi:hypothetical protein